MEIVAKCLCFADALRAATWNLALPNMLQQVEPNKQSIGSSVMVFAPKALFLDGGTTVPGVCVLEAMSQLDHEKATFDCILGFLTLIEAGKRETALERFRKKLNPGGTIFVEDLLVPQGDETCLASIEAYVAALEKLGFVDIRIVDVTDGWHAQCRQELATGRCPAEWNG